MQFIDQPIREQKTCTSAGCYRCARWAVSCKRGASAPASVLSRMSLTTSAACCNPTPFKSVSFRRHPLVVVNAIEALQTTFEGQIEVPRVQGSPYSV